MVNDRDAPIEHLSINMLSAVLEPMINNAVANSVHSIQSELNTHSSQISSLQQENSELKQAFITQADRQPEKKKKLDNTWTGTHTAGGLRFPAKFYH